MKGVCGWFSDCTVADGARILQAMLDARSRPESSAHRFVGDEAALAAWGRGADVRWAEVDGITLAALGHPQHRGGTAPQDLAGLALAWRSRGPSALAHMGGDFALVAWDARSRIGLLAVDRLAIHPMSYARVGGMLAFATTLDPLRALPGLVPRLSKQAIYDYLYYHVVPGPTTIFEEQHRIAPGHCLEFGRGPGTPVAYWTPRFTEDKSASFDQLRSRFRSTLDAAVAEATREARCGTFLSGGTDSSTVTGMLTKLGGAPARAFSIGFDAQGYDETGYARIAAKHFGCEHHEYYVTPGDVVDAVQKIAAAYDQPFGNASAVPTYYCARLAREHGIERMLAGDGGDELFGGNDRYGRQYLLSLYEHLPAALRDSVVEPMLLRVSEDSAIVPLRKLRSYVVQARPPMPLRYESYNVFQHLGAGNVLSDDFLASIDAGHPRRLMHETHAHFRSDSLINQMLGMDLRFTLTDNDLPKVTQMCGLAGVDVAFPLLDDRLMDFAAALPARMKLRGTRLRWFFKEALRDFLPIEIIRKKKHGFGLPVGHWLQSHRPLFDLAMAGAEPLVGRGIVRRGFLDDLIGPRMKEDAAYFGNMLWVLMMLGLWLQSRRL